MGYSFVMTSKIHLLSNETINQIAAGEVVEGPSSVVKELVENAIDAGATRVTIEIKGGGHLLIRIVDDGCGMSLEDAKMSLQRHATSKICHVDDLSRLSSMGFRGEALASIASISKLRLVTSLDGDQAFEVVSHGGGEIVASATSRTKGTTFEIGSLFYNTPARRKFQKSASRSSAEIMKCVTKLSLAHKGVAFELISQDITLLKTTNDPNRRIEEALGSEFSKDVREVFFEEEQHFIKGIVGTPLKTRQNRSGQYLFVNERPIYSPLVADTVKDAFGTRIASRDFPIFVLWMKLPSDLIDVNVHPQKHTIRFQNEEMIRHYVIKAVQSALLGEEVVVLPKFEAMPKTLQEKPARYTPVSKPSPVKIPKESLFVSREIEPQFEVLGFVDSYAIIEQIAGISVLGDGKSMVFLDLIQMQSRLVFDDVLKRLQNQSQVAIQSLLFAETIELSPVEAEIVLENLSLLKTIGFEIRPGKGGAFFIEGIAPMYVAASAKEVVQKLVQEMKVEVNFEKMAYLVAGSLSSKKIYAKLEVKAMVSQLLKSLDPEFSPSGKRIFLSIDKITLDQIFSKTQKVYASSSKSIK